MSLAVLHEKLWKDWDAEDWANAVYCQTCGLPMFEVPEQDRECNETHQCVYCAWVKDQEKLFKLRLTTLYKDIDRIRTDIYGDLNDLAFSRLTTLLTRLKGMMR